MQSSKTNYNKALEREQIFAETITVKDYQWYLNRRENPRVEHDFYTYTEICFKQLIHANNSKKKNGGQR